MPEPRCFGCGSPERRFIVVRDAGFVRDARNADEPTAPGEQVIEISLVDDYSFCRSCRIAIPDSERVSREARRRAARGTAPVLLDTDDSRKDAP